LPQSTLSPTDPLVQAARQQGEEIVPADGAIAQRSYEAQDGDTVSRMAAKFLGSSSHKNVKAIIAANPSLQADPNKVIAGQSYIIPTPGSSSSSPTLTATVAGQTTSPAGGWTYTVKEGDTLWGIATGQLGSANAIAAIKELNATLLHGGSTLRPGMVLRLPSQPVAIAD
jgi:nucleoid-associated protein YgaU